MEYFDVVDINRNKINKILPRGSKLNPNEFNVGIEVWITNSYNQLLLTQRSSLKSHPLQWECPGGCLISGETSKQAVIREIKEEIGLDISTENFKFITTSLYKYQFIDIYTIKIDIDSNKLCFQEDEVVDAKWVSISDFLVLHSKNQIVPSVYQRYNLIKEKLF